MTVNYIVVGVFALALILISFQYTLNKILVALNEIIKILNQMNMRSK